MIFRFLFIVWEDGEVVFREGFSLRNVCLEFGRYFCGGLGRWLGLRVCGLEKFED